MSQSDIVFECEFCEQEVVFPIELAGSCENCPHCFEYIDIPMPQQHLVRADVEDCEHYAEVDINGISHPLIFDLAFGLPHPRWDEFIEALDPNLSDEVVEHILNQAVTHWLHYLASHLAEDYRLWESDEFYLLSNRKDDDIPQLLGFCEQTRETILQMISEAASAQRMGKHVIVSIADPGAFYSYVTTFFPEGEFGSSVGFFLDAGFAHIVVIDGFDWPRTVAHELTHFVMRHLPLPLWLNEGVTQIVEDHVFDHDPFEPDAELMARMNAYWNPDNIVHFWSGESFHFPDEGQELSYVLARGLVWNLSNDSSISFWTFVRNASAEDAGNGAAIETFGRSLGDIAADYLGTGNWEPPVS